MAAQLNFNTGDYVGFGTTGTAVAGTASFSSAALSNVIVGDLLVAIIHSQAGVTGSITPPSGWTQYGVMPGVPDASTSRITSIFYYPVKTSADITSLGSTPTWTFSTNAGRVACVVARATGIDLTIITDAAATSYNNTSSTSSFTPTGITTTSPNALVIGAIFHQNSASTTSPTTTSFMTGFTEYKTSPTGSANANTGVSLGYMVQPSAGATNTVIASFDSAVTVVGGELVSFTAIASGSGGSGGAAAYPTVLSTPTTYITSSAVTAFTITKPSGVQDGDCLILALTSQSPTATADFTSSGWSRIGQPFVASSGGIRVVGFYALPVPTASSVTATNFTFTSTDSASGGRIAAEMFIVRGANLSNLVATYWGYSGSSQTSTLTAVTTPNDKSLLLAVFDANFTSALDYTINTGPAGMTQQTFLPSSTAAVSKTVLAVYQENVDSGTTGNKSLIWNANPPSQASGTMLVINSSTTTMPANNGLAVHYTSATGVMTSAKLYYTSATDTLSTPKEIRPVPYGYPSVAAMLATSHFTVAHRGGSLDWPEMSLYAYSQAAFWGVGALELSLARTSDGVWFGLHDASLDRTSLNSGGGSGVSLVASSLTWAQVQTYSIQYPSITNAGSLPQPYMRWEQIMASYYGTHVIFVDPKYASSYTNEILNMMDAMPNTPTNHFVGKSYGQSGNVGNTTGFPHDAAARGYKNWGYFYEADYGNGNLATYQGRYDILGMDYTATSAAWTSVMSYSKPVIGHIVPNASGATTAFGYGAAGLMVSGVQEVVTRSANPSQA